MVFLGCGFISGGQKSGSRFCAAVCKIQASKCFIKFLPLVLKDNIKVASLKVKGLLYSCLSNVHLPSESRTHN